MNRNTKLFIHENKIVVNEMAAILSGCGVGGYKHAIWPFEICWKSPHNHYWSLAWHYIFSRHQCRTRTVTRYNWWSPEPLSSCELSLCPCVWYDNTISIPPWQCAPVPNESTWHKCPHFIWHCFWNHGNCHAMQPIVYSRPSESC